MSIITSKNIKTVQLHQDIEPSDKTIEIYKTNDSIVYIKENNEHFYIAPMRGASDRVYWAGYRTNSELLDRLLFSDETLSANHTQMPNSHRIGNVFSSWEYGFMYGGTNSSGYHSEYDKFSFFNDSTGIMVYSEIVNDNGHHPSEGIGSTYNSSQYGYAISGYSSDGGNPSTESIKFNMANDTKTFFDFSSSFKGASGSNSTMAGYSLGGSIATYGMTTVRKLVFATDVSSTLSNSLPYAGSRTYGFNSTIAGYGARGYGDNGTVVYTNNVFKIVFSTETSSMLSGLLSEKKHSIGSANSRSYGLTIGGAIDGGKTSAIDKIDFATDTVSVYSVRSSEPEDWVAAVDNIDSTGYIFG